MLLLMLSAAFVGLIHSLAPGHWLPVVLLAKARRWNWEKAVLGALVTASGHVIISLAVGGVAIWVGVHLLVPHEEMVERYAGLILAVLGALFAVQAYFRHSSCGDAHSHHGPEAGQEQSKSAFKTFAFLFTLGFAPCIAVLPVFAAAVPYGAPGVSMAMIAFSVGVVVAIVTATLLGRIGASLFDHPVFEHYGDVVTGVGITLVGLGIFGWSFLELH